MPYRQSYLKRSICLAMLMGGALPTAPSFAQEFTLEEVIVTARKREESVNDIPVAVTAMSGDQMEALQAFNPDELAQYVPGMTVVGDVYTIRGIGFNAANPSSSGTVGVSYDQATLPYPVMSRGMTFDIERVEVLKGPQGTLYGRSTTGGQINYIFNKPTDEFEASVMVEGGNYDSWGAEAIVSGPVLGDTLRARVGIKTQQSEEGWQKNILNNERRGEDDRTSGRLVLDYTPTDELGIMLTYHRWEDKSQTTSAQVLAAVAENPFYTQPFADANGRGYNPLFITGRALGLGSPLWDTIQPDHFQARLDVAQARQDAVRSNWDNDMGVWGFRGTQDDINGWYDLASPHLRVPLGQDPRSDRENDMVDLKVTWDLTDSVTLISQTTYNKYQSTVVGWGDTAGYALSGVPSDVDQESWQTELRFTGDIMDGRMTYNIGGMYAEDDAWDEQSIHLPHATAIYSLRDFGSSLAATKQLYYDATALFLGVDQANAIYGSRPTDQEIIDASVAGRSWQPFQDSQYDYHAVFAQSTYEINDEWGVEAGARYQKMEGKSRSCTRQYEGLGHFAAAWNWLFYAMDDNYAGNGGVVLPSPPLPAAVPLNIIPLPDGSVNGFFPWDSQAGITAGSNISTLPGPNALGPFDCIETELTAETVDPLDPNNTIRRPVDAGGRPHELDEEAISARIAVNYRPTDDIMYYGSIAQGYKSGVFTTTSASSSNGLEPVDQEKVVAYEVGFKWSATDTVHWNASAYFYDYQDKQLNGTIQDPFFGDLTALLNVPESEVYGVETDVTWAPNANWFITANAAYLQTEVTSDFFGNDPSGAEPINFNGEEFALSPEYQATLMVSYNFDVLDNWNLRITGDVSYTAEQDGQLASSDPLFKVEEYTLVGVNVNLNSHDGLWEVNLWGKNVTDEYYWGTASQNTDQNLRSGIGEPRTWGLQVRRNF